MIRGTANGRAAKLGLLLGLSIALTGCQSTSSSTYEELAPEDDAPIFSSSIFGVKASPRVTRLKKVPKGGGRDQTGKPYMVRGKWYYPKEEPGYVKSGTASWYGANFHGRLTANGEVYDMYSLSAAHPTFPLPSYARVTNKKNGSSVLVRVNDRGPYMHNRVLDVSAKAADLLGFQNDGVADVKVEYAGRAPLEGDDTQMLMASYRPANSRVIDSGLPSGVMIAQKQEKSPLMVASAFSAPSRVQSQIKVAPQRTPSIEDLIQTYEDTPSSVPVPMSRSALMSFAPLPSESRSYAALQSLVAPTTTGETIEIGELSDITALARIAQLAKDRGDLTESVADGRMSLSLTLRPGEDADRLLREIWAAGAVDAFTVKSGH